MFAGGAADHLCVGPFLVSQFVQTFNAHIVLLDPQEKSYKRTYRLIFFSEGNI